MENTFIYKYVFFFPNLNIDQILRFSVVIFMTFTATARQMRKVFHVFTSSFFLCNTYEGLWNGCSCDGGRLGSGQPVLLEG